MARGPFRPGARRCSSGRPPSPQDHGRAGPARCTRPAEAWRCAADDARRGGRIHWVVAGGAEPEGHRGAAGHSAGHRVVTGGSPAPPGRGPRQTAAGWGLSEPAREGPAWERNGRRGVWAGTWDVSTDTWGVQRGVYTGVQAGVCGGPSLVASSFRQSRDDAFAPGDFAGITHPHPWPGGAGVRQTPPVSQSTPPVSNRVSERVSIGVYIGSREKTERWNLHLPTDLITQTKTRAQALGMHPSKLVAEVLRQWLTARGQEDIE